jgi:hypothetical protein
MLWRRSFVTSPRPLAAAAKPWLHGKGDRFVHLHAVQARLVTEAPAQPGPCAHPHVLASEAGRAPRKSRGMEDGYVGVTGLVQDEDLRRRSRAPSGLAVLWQFWRKASAHSAPARPGPPPCVFCMVGVEKEQRGAWGPPRATEPGSGAEPRSVLGPLCGSKREFCTRFRGHRRAAGAPRRSGAGRRGRLHPSAHTTRAGDPGPRATAMGGAGTGAKPPGLEGRNWM